MVGEVIEVRDKPVQPWGTRVSMAFGDRSSPLGTGMIRQAIVALGRLDTVTDGLIPPVGMTVLGMSSDHLILNIGEHPTVVGDEISFALGYSALMRATSSPYVTPHFAAEATLLIEHTLPVSSRITVSRRPSTTIPEFSARKAKPHARATTVATSTASRRYTPSVKSECSDAVVSSTAGVQEHDEERVVPGIDVRDADDEAG